MPTHGVLNERRAEKQKARTELSDGNLRSPLWRLSHLIL